MPIGLGDIPHNVLRPSDEFGPGFSLQEKLDAFIPKLTTGQSGQAPLDQSTVQFIRDRAVLVYYEELNKVLAAAGEPSLPGSWPVHHEKAWTNTEKRIIENP